MHQRQKKNTKKRVVSHAPFRHLITPENQPLVWRSDEVIQSYGVAEARLEDYIIVIFCIHGDAADGRTGSKQQINTGNCGG